MRQERGRSRAALGFAVKSGWAAAVLVSGSAKSPRVTESRKIELSDPAVPAARQPYHEGFGTARSSGPKLARLLASVETFGRRSVSDVIQDFKTAGHELSGAGIVVGSLIDPASIANDHIRIHALEGRLFRGVVEDAAARRGLACTIWRERDLYEVAAGTLKQTEQEVRNTVTALGRDIAGSWRAEQKVATLAAWLVLAVRVSV